VASEEHRPSNGIPAEIKKSKDRERVTSLFFFMLHLLKILSVLSKQTTENTEKILNINALKDFLFPPPLCPLIFHSRTSGGVLLSFFMPIFKPFFFKSELFLMKILFDLIN
jgi:hypothetical protein